MCKNCKFTKPTKTVLEVEAGFACANPSCRRTTVSPSNVRVTGLSQRGEAAHIAAAKKDMARYDENQTHDERSSSDNGIWLCRDHAKAIDDDWDRYTTALLHEWKRLARTLAQERADSFPQVASQSDLVQYSRSLQLAALDKESQRADIAEFLEDVGAGAIWDEGAVESVRQVLTEWCFNAATHGAASRAELSSESRSITVRHNGHAFSIDALLESRRRRGGANAFDFFIQTFGDYFALGEVDDGGQIGLVVSDVRHHAAPGNPCSISSDELADLSLGDLQGRAASCAETHVYVRSRWTMSDGYEDLPKLAELASSTQRTLVIHSDRVSPMLAAFVSKELPGARVANADKDQVKR